MRRRWQHCDRNRREQVRVVDHQRDTDGLGRVHASGGNQIGYHDVRSARAHFA